MNNPVSARLFSARLYRVAVIVAALANVDVCSSADQSNTIDLAGSWTFRLDPQDVGVDEQWSRLEFSQTVRLPGSLQEHGYGQEPSLDTNWTGTIRTEIFELPRYATYRDTENFKMPFWLQPQHHYVGPAWYQRLVTIPDDWQGQRILLHLERCHWFTTVWVDGLASGHGESLSAPHEFDLSDVLSPGDHNITIRVDNRLKINVGRNSHSVTDHTQTNWNGIIGSVALRAEPAIGIDDVQAFPDVTRRSVRVVVTLRNHTGKTANVRLSAQAQSGGESVGADSRSVRLETDTTRCSFDLQLDKSVPLWDEHDPHLCKLQVRLTDDATDQREITFGMREVSTRGTQFVLNGQPVFLRGTLECCIFPLTGYPATDVPSWRRIIRQCKDFGLNHIRFHSWCPPEAAFVAADELGFYFQIECASWANGGASVGDGKPLDAWLYREADRILAAYGNHPSFLLLAYGNEPAGPGRQGSKYLGPWVEHYKERATRQVITCAAGWPYIPENEFHVMHRPLRLHGEFNRQAPSTVGDYREHVAKHAVPLISHETGQWCVFPNLQEMEKYAGVLQARNFEIVRDFLEARGLQHQATDFLMASGRFQTLLYKEEIETMLRTPGFGGFQLLDLHDFPGQGTALVGVLDPFWDAKPYITAEQFRCFCGPVVPLARLGRRVWSKNEMLAAAVEVSQFGPDDLHDVNVNWSLQDDTGQLVGRGDWTHVGLPRGGLHEIGELTCSLANVNAPSRLTLTVSVPAAEARNAWDVWIYPDQADLTPTGDVYIAREFADEAEARLRSGGKVLLLPPSDSIAGDTRGSFEPIFWNRLWFPTQPVHTLGILCDPRHPAFRSFPTDSHSNWQWWDLCNRSKPMILDDLPRALSPLVQVIDDWNTCRKLALMFEVKVGGGKLLVCSAELTDDLDRRPVARQLRHSILQYMASDEFAPRVEVSLSDLRQLLRSP